MWNLFYEIWPDNNREITLHWNDNSQDDYLWFTTMGKTLSWDAKNMVVPIAWKYK